MHGSIKEGDQVSLYEPISGFIESLEGIAVD